jgi:hypothetical protein
VEAVDLNLVAADHEVRVDVGAVDAHAPSGSMPARYLKKPA